MSERKAINKWYPPDWDPSQVQKKKKSNAAEKVRLMLPFSMKCLLCNEYIAARRKFNARKEVTGDKYMGIKIIKFHIKCPRCNNAIVFKTDPKSAGFVPVEGGVRNYESSTETKIKPMETEDEIFARLEREDTENQKFQEQRDKRKKNPFWQAQSKNPDKNVMENLQEKLEEQQKEQEMYDHLAYLQAKAERMQQSGGSDTIAQEIRDQMEEKRKLDRDLMDYDTKKRMRVDVSTGHPQVSEVIRVKRPRNGRVPGRNLGNITGIQNDKVQDGLRADSVKRVLADTTEKGDAGSSSPDAKVQLEINQVQDKMSDAIPQMAKSNVLGTSTEPTEPLQPRHSGCTTSTPNGCKLPEIKLEKKPELQVLTGSLAGLAGYSSDDE